VIRSIVLCALVLGCGGECIPKEAKNAESFAIDDAAKTDVRLVRSADDLRAAIGNAHLSFPQANNVAHVEPEATEAEAHKRLDEFIAATNFTTSDVALVQAGGGERALLRGLTTKDATTTLYFTGVCSTCGGGNPGSYESARASEEAARTPRTELVRVPKGARVVVQMCSMECGSCSSNVP
jgi:hypothetical protein